MTRLPIRLLMATTLLASAGAAQAVPTYYSYSRTDLPTSGSAPAQDGSTPLYADSGGGHVSAIRTTYNPHEETFTWEYTVTAENDGFWLVISDGDNPKGDTNEYAILFGDLTKNRVSAYMYNGKNSANSLTDPGILLETFDNVFTVSPATTAGPGGTAAPTKTVSLELNVASLNTDTSRIPGEDVASLNAGGSSTAVKKDWDGVAFGPSLGIWFHATSDTKFTYNDEEEITRFHSTNRGYLDGGNFVTREVPEPGMLYLAGLGLCALSFSRKLSGRKRTV